MEWAIAQNQADAVLGILRCSDIDINQPCDPLRYGSVSPLVTALRANRADITSLIAVQPGFDLARSLPDYERWTWVRTSSLSVLRHYLGIPGSDVNQTDGNGKTLLHEVVYDAVGHAKLRELLARPGTVIDAQQIDGTTPLYQAGLAGNTDAVRALRDLGADVNNRNDDNLWTILICAVAACRAEIAELLLASPGIEPNAVDDIRQTALHIAAERGHNRMVELLLRHPRIKVNAQDHMGWTPLSKAAFAGHAAVTRLLLARPDLDVNRADQDWQTPLFHAAAAAGNADIVRMLLADPRIDSAISNQPGHLTALDMAVALGFHAIADLLRQRDGGSRKTDCGTGETEADSGFPLW